MVKILADDQQGEVESLSYRYDTLSQLVKALSNNNSVILEYDRALNLKSQIQNGMDVQSLYDEQSHKQLESLTFLDHTQSYQYDAQNRVSQLISNQEEKFEFNYDENEILQERKYPNQTKEQYGYDENYNLITIEAKGCELKYDYDEIGRVRLKKNKKDEDAKLFHPNFFTTIIINGNLFIMLNMLRSIIAHYGSFIMVNVVVRVM